MRGKPPTKSVNPPPPLDWAKIVESICDAAILICLIYFLLN